ncbi:MAG TPA: DUF488 family protein [Saprospiraceae bacterium]|nr:DUF488 family protein [Saprospiraceae bacterium]
MDKIRLQKLLFLFSLKQTKAEYDFVPYKYGCYSYSANADLTTMVSKGLLAESQKHFDKLDRTDYLKLVKPDDLKRLQQVKAEYGKMSSKVLMKHTYINYPFYATKSEVAGDILTETELQKVNAAKPRNNETVLFTIGYEGISLEEYLVRLLKKDVKVLVDVRNNPLSMKYGFSKSQLKRYCENLGIKYVHIPEVGIQSEQRQELKTQTDYDKLFSVYRKNNLTKTVDSQTQILNLLKEYKRIALTCFEANICQCHRKHLAEAIETLPGFQYKVEHI